MTFPRTKNVSDKSGIVLHLQKNVSAWLTRRQWMLISVYASHLSWYYVMQPLEEFIYEKKEKAKGKRHLSIITKTALSSRVPWKRALGAPGPRLLRTAEWVSGRTSLEPGFFDFESLFFSLHCTDARSLLNGITRVSPMKAFLEKADAVVQRYQKSIAFETGRLMVRCSPTFSSFTLSLLPFLLSLWQSNTDVKSRFALNAWGKRCLRCRSLCASFGS